MMTETSNLSDISADLAARQLIAAAIAAATRDPWASEREPKQEIPIDLLGDAWNLVAAPHSAVTQRSLGLGETPPAAGDPSPLARWLGLPRDLRERVCLAVFGLVISKDCPPYETEFYPSREAASRAQHMADTAGFYSAFGLALDARSPERADHASLIIGFVSFLLRKLAMIAADPAHGPADSEHEYVVRAALASFIQDHVAWWLPAFGRCVELRAERLASELNDAPMQSALTDMAGVGRLLRAWVAAERLNAGVTPPRRIVEPTLAHPEPDEGCHTSCGGCGGGSDV